VRGDAIGQGEELLEPALLAAAVVGHVLEALRLADDGADGDDQDVDQPTLDLAGVARIRDGLELLDQLLDHRPSSFCRGGRSYQLTSAR
jgi:hypothetical protein